MRIRFFCPTCHQPLSADSCFSGQGLACPTCRENLIIPTQSSLCASDPHALRSPRRLGVAVLAGTLLAAALGIGAVIPRAFFGKVVDWELAPLEPGGEPKTEPQTPPDEEFDPLQAKREAPSSEVLEPAAGLPKPRGWGFLPEPGWPAVPDPDDIEEDQADPALANLGGAKPAANDSMPSLTLRVGVHSPAPQRQADPPNAEPAPPVAKAQPTPELDQPKALANVKPVDQIKAPANGKVVDQPRVQANGEPAKRNPGGVRQRWESKRRSHLTDVELQAQLQQPPEVDLEAIPGTIQKVISISGKLARTGIDVIPQIAAQRSDLVGLPLHESHLARIGPEEALNLKVLSQRLRLQVQASIPGQVKGVVDPRPDATILRKRLLDNPLRAAWLRPQAIATLRQLLMHEHRNVRLVFVDVLSKIEGKQAAVALAERAIFDLDPDVRLAALFALKNRSVGEYEQTLVAALRYPWPAFADHAAEALVALDLRDTVPDLIKLLDARALAEPFLIEHGKSQWAMVPELVRVNHLRNCLLCHAYSTSPADPVRGLVPNAERVIPLPVATIQLGYGGGNTSNESGLSIIKQTFIRADINFLRQDFSITQPVPKHGRFWPADQRFDYLVRMRPISSKQLLSWQDRVKDFQPPESQRESLLFALRELTGENPGPTSEEWKRRYSTLTGRRFGKPLEPKDQALHIRDCLVEAAPQLQLERLKAIRDKSGTTYDSGLALAIPQLKPELQSPARTILSDRFFCLSLAMLRQKLGDQDEEVRRAAVTVARQRRLKALVPQLIDLLDDSNQDLARLVHDLLRQFASKDFGPRRGADHEQRLEAMAAWRLWWEQRNEKLAVQKQRRSS